MDKNVPNVPITIRRLVNPSHAEIKQAVNVILAAFGGDDGFNNFLVGGDRSLVPVKFESNIRAAAIGGEVFVASLGFETDDIVGVAAWYGPGQASNTTEEQREVNKKFLSKLPEDLMKWWLEHVIPLLERLAIENIGPGVRDTEWYLPLFGVAPEHHRKGVGKALMKVAEERAKADGVSMVLETSTDLDLLIYKRMGFEVKGQTTLTCSLGEAPVYIMMKMP
ncbi:hypothetical protein FPV67DRAFT_1665496 [Lyophyllum atratum]|nr:hypothetical protein FPV67DRAFT_1665496 [Lyophyllum atratum]